MSYFDDEQSTGYQQTSSLAVISLFTGIASFGPLPLLGAVAAVITGMMAKNEIAQSAGRLTGEGMARWGLILGWVNIGLYVIGFCLVMLMVFGAISLPFCLIPALNGLSY